MNNRYKELARQATDYCCDRAESQAWLWEEKFAELIIKECINNIEALSICFDNDVARGMRHAARLTKEYFEIES